MNSRIPSQALAQSAVTTVFVSGNSQAVRLPKAFRVNTKQVTIERRGDEIVLREQKRTLGQALREALASTPPLSRKEVLGMDKALARCKDQGAVEERAMWADASFWDSPSSIKPLATAKATKATVTQRRKKIAAK